MRPAVAGMRRVIRGLSMWPMSRSAGVWRYVYRAIDQRGQVIDVLVAARRDGPPTLSPRVGHVERGTHRGRDWRGTCLPAGAWWAGPGSLASRRAVRNNRIEADDGRL